MVLRDRDKHRQRASPQACVFGFIAVFYLGKRPTVLMDKQKARGCRSKQQSVELCSERIKDLRTGGPGNLVLKLSVVV